MACLKCYSPNAPASYFWWDCMVLSTMVLFRMWLHDWWGLCVYHKCTTTCSQHHMSEQMPWKIHWYFLKDVWRRSQIPIALLPLPFLERHCTGWFLSLIARDPYKMSSLPRGDWLRLLGKRVKAWSWLSSKRLLCGLVERILGYQSGNRRSILLDSNGVCMPPAFRFQYSLKKEGLWIHRKAYEFTHRLVAICHSWALLDLPLCISIFPFIK